MKFISGLTGGPAVIVHLSHTVSKISLLASFRIFYKFLTDRNFMSLYTNRSIINYEHFFKIFFSRLVLHTCTNEPRKSVRNVKACDQQHAIPEFNFRVLVSFFFFAGINQFSCLYIIVIYQEKKFWEM